MNIASATETRPLKHAPSKIISRRSNTTHPRRPEPSTKLLVISQFSPHKAQFHILAISFARRNTFTQKVAPACGYSAS